MADYDSILLIVKAIIGAVVVIGLTVYVLRPLFRSAPHTGERLRSVNRSVHSRRLEDEELEIPTSKSSDVSKQAIIQRALDDPLKTTQLVRNWLREKK